MKILSCLLINIIIVLTVAGSPARAYFTGTSKIGVSPTGKQVISCEYAYGASKFWQTFKCCTCPASVEVE